MKTGTIIAIIVILFIGIIAFVWLSGDADDVTVNVENALEDTFQNATNTEADRIGESYRTYQNSAFPFTFSYPQEANVAVEENKVVATYIGPDSAVNSEISDGFTFSIETQEIEGDATLEEFAEEVFAQQTENLEVVASTSAASVGNAPAYEFQVESQLGTTLTYVVIEATDGQAFVVSYFVADPANRGYGEAIEQMLNSLQYEESEEAATTTVQ